MGKLIRILLAIVVMLGIVLLAKNQVAWAANSSNKTNYSGLAAPLAQNDPCDKPNGMQGKDNHRCRGGSVLPPADDIEVCERGNYSVGGVATLDVRNLRGEGCMSAYTSGDQPPTALSETINLTLPARGANLKICFAVPPGESAKIYTSQAGSWTALKTKVKDGIACAEINQSGNYTLLSQ